MRTTRLLSALLLACICFTASHAVVGQDIEKAVFGFTADDVPEGTYFMEISFQYGPSYEALVEIDGEGELGAYIDSQIEWDEGAAIVVNLFAISNSTSTPNGMGFVFQTNDFPRNNRPPNYPPIPGDHGMNLPPYHSFPIDEPIIGPPRPQDPDEEDEEGGVTYDPEDPKNRTLRVGDTILEYTREVDQNGNASGGIDIDWVEGRDLANLLRLILISEGGTIPEIKGFTTDRLGRIPDRFLENLGNGVGNSLPGDWETEITYEGNRRYITLRRVYDDE